MAYILSLDPNNTAQYAAEEFDAIVPNYAEREAYGERFLSERDFPIYDQSADMARVSNEDWEMFLGSRY